MSTPQPRNANERLLLKLVSIPRIVPILAVVALLALGIFVPGFGWIFTAVVVAFLLWMLQLSWPRLTNTERLMRIAVVFFLAAITVVQAHPRG